MLTIDSAAKKSISQGQEGDKLALRQAIGAIAALAVVGSAPTPTHKDPASEAWSDFFSPARQLAVEDTMDVLPRPIETFGSYDRIILSPSGRYMSGWLASAEERATEPDPEHWGELFVASTDCIKPNPKNCIGDYIQSTEVLSPPIWAADEKTFYVPNHRYGLIEFGVDGTGPTISKIRRVWPFVHGPTEFLHFRGSTERSSRDLALFWLKQATAAVKTLLNEGTIRSITMNSGGLVGAVVMRNDDLNALAVTDLQAAPTDLKIKYDQFYPLDIWATGQSRILYGVGLAYEVKHGPSLSTTPLPVRPFSQPIFEAATGDVIGTFDDRNLTFLQADPFLSRAQETVRQFLAVRPYLAIRSVSVSASGRIVAVLATDVYGYTTIAIVHPNGMATSYECQPIPDATGIDHSTQREPYVMQVENIGTARWPIWTHWYRGNGPRRGIVLFLHGGPADSDVDGSYDLDIARFMELGYDLLVPEYSGSSGVGIQTGERLAKEGANAIRQDASILRSLVTGALRRRYRSTVLYAVGYGGVYELTDELGTKGVFDRTVLVEPFLKYRAGAGGISARNTEYLKQLEHFVMGAGTESPSAIDRWMSSRSRMQLPRSPTLMLYAEGDPTAKPGDLPDAGRSPYIRQETIRSSSPSTIRLGNDMWSRIAEFLNSSPSPSH